MPTSYVNLDALLIREDFYVWPTSGNPPPPSRGDDFPISQLAHGQAMAGVLRKPEFQRETSYWKPESIVELVKNFLDEELIPAVILWKAPDKSIFVIDGAHRLSALIAWVNDDYGDREASERFSQHKVTRAQRKVAEATRELMRKEVGTYAYLHSLIQNPRKEASPDDISRGRNIASVTVKTQWVLGDAKHAEDSFKRINKGGSVISPAELAIISSRKHPESIAARALLRRGTGYEFWKAYDDKTRARIVELAKEIYDMLFEPEVEDPIKTMELPVGGHGYSGNSLEVLSEFIHVANELQRAKPPKKLKRGEVDQEPDRNIADDGVKTVTYLEKVKDVTERISSDLPKSLGFHPAVYSWSATGKFQPTAFFVQVRLINHLKEKSLFMEFTDYRNRFEEFLVSHKHFINQLVGKYGALTRSLETMFKMYLDVFGRIKSGQSDAEIKQALLATEEYGLRDLAIAPKKGGKFSSSSKAAVRLRDALEKSVRCSECGARYHPYANTIDHTELRSRGGSADPNNGTPMHPICNSGKKQKRIHEEDRAKKSAPGG